MDELEHPGWCDPVHCTATTQKPRYRAGETGYHRSTPVVLEGVPNVGDIVFDAELNPLLAHLAQAGPPWEPVPHLNIGTVADPELVSLPVAGARTVLRQLEELVSRDHAALRAAVTDRRAWVPFGAKAAASRRNGSGMTVAEQGAEQAQIDPERLAICLSVLAEAEGLPPEHPDAVLVRRATGSLFKAVKLRRRKDKRDEIAAADRAVISATATGAPGRIDDETAGILLRATAASKTVGTLRKARPCYICKEDYREVDAFYHQLCPACAALNHQRRAARTDLTGRRALLTGGRAKIGMYIALRLLRDGAHTTITTRFPNDAIRRFSSMPDSADWLGRLRVVGIDLRDPAQVIRLADSVAAQGPLDILINNAAQTVRRTTGAYSQLIAAELEPLPDGPRPDVLYLGAPPGAEPGVLTAPQAAMIPAHAVTALALTTGSATPERIAAGTAIDAGGLVPDLESSNSWVQRVEQVEPLELLEVQLCNVTAPFVLVSRLRPALAAAGARRKYVVNVSAMEGQFGRGYKGPGHPHTNMAKAALNMLTRTSAAEMLETDGILMTSVDTGWITDERPHPTKMRLADEGFKAPLDLIDGAARVYDPIVRGELGEDLYGCFLKDYARSPW